MRRILMICTALTMLFVSCAHPVPAPYFVNNEFGGGCVLGDLYLEDLGGIRTVTYSPDGKREGLCRDPLCTHEYARDGLCPDVAAFGTKSFATDGTRLYFASIIIWQADAGLKRGIYSIQPDGTDFRMLYEGEIAPNNSWDLAVSDGYLYFEEGHYKVDYDPLTDRTEISDQYGAIVRIPVDGGQAEQLTEEREGVGSTIAADRDTLCLVRVGRDGESILERVDCKTGETVQIPLPGDFESVWPRFVDGALYLAAANSRTVKADRGDGTAAHMSGQDWFLYRSTGDGWECLAESESRFVFAGNEVWFVREGEAEYLGTRAFPTGRGSETAERDIFDTHARRLFRLDLGTGEGAELPLSRDIAPSESVELIAVGETVVYMMLSDPHLLLEGSPSKTLICADRETLSVIWRCEP